MIKTHNVEPVTFDQIAYLHIRYFFNQAGRRKTHWYAKIHHNGTNKIKHEVTYPVEKEKAEKLNKKDKLDGFKGPFLSEGDETIRFDKRHLAIDEAVKWLWKNRPDIKVLIDGEPGKQYPQHVIFGPEQFIMINNGYWLSYKTNPNYSSDIIKNWKVFFPDKKE